MTPKEIIETASLVVGIFGGLFAAGRAIIQRQDELRWRKANAANELLNRFYNDQLFRDALTMLDWSGRPFEIKPDHALTITHDEIVKALRVDQAISYEEKDVFIRTCFDRLFEAFERLEQAVRMGVITYNDVGFAFEFYIKRLAEHKWIVTNFMKSMGFDYALEFFNKCDAWKNASDHMGKP